MSLSKKEVEHIAQLARLSLSEEEKEKFTQELSSILSYIDKLKELPEKKVRPAAPGMAGRKEGRGDEVVDFKDKKKILENAPKISTDFIEVKGVFK